jgi:hypothetical protein
MSNKSPDNTPQNDALAAKDLELAETREALRQAEGRLKQVSARNAVDPEAMKHPAAFMGQDGRTYYKYQPDGEQGEIIITPKPIEEMVEQDWYDMPISLFDGMAGRIPQNLTVTFKDPQWAGQWFNKKAGDGARVGVARALGFVPAKKQDLSSYFAGLNDRDGAVEQHDLVLMKIHKGKLYMKYAEWIALAKKRGSINGYKNMAENSMPSGRKPGLVGFHHTPQALTEIQGLGKAPNEL